MWRYILFSFAWFGILFSCHWLRRRIFKWTVFGLMVFLALAAAAKGGIDPFAWFFYFGASWAAFWTGAQFKTWVLGRFARVDGELADLSKRLSAESGLLAQKCGETESTARRADEIAYLYEKIKEMSQSFESYGTLLIFGEALSRSFRFGSAKLAVFDAEEPNPKEPREAYELSPADFEGIFDRARFLSDKKRRKAVLFPSDQERIEAVFEKRSVVSGKEPDFWAGPVLVNKKISAVLVLSEVHGDARMLSILVERFISEIQRVKLYERIETLAITDGLTGVHVRRHLLERFEREVERSKRFGLKLSFLMVDVDYFKRFNDEHGHLVGDEVLRRVADTIRANTRELDLVGRYGGEEFGVLLVETDASAAFFIAQRIRQAVETRAFKIYGENLKVTVSIGCSTFSERLSDPALIIDAADSALYQAKRQGRNKVCVDTLSAPNENKV